MISRLRFSTNNRENFWDFSSKESTLRWCREIVVMEELAQRPLVEQLKVHSIRKIVVKPLSLGTAYLLSNADGTFKILLDVASPLEWPLSMGHEMCHTYFYSLAIYGTRRIPFYRWNPQHEIEEEVCEQFAEIWKEKEKNFHKTYELLASIAEQGGTLEIF